jgi:hypothetical protein
MEKAKEKSVAPRTARSSRNGRNRRSTKPGTSEGPSELRQFGGGGAVICILVGAHAATAQLLAHQLVWAILSAATGALCGALLWGTVRVLTKPAKADAKKRQARRRKQK